MGAEMREYKIAYEGGSGEYIEKKSRFIGTMVPIASESEAAEYIEKHKKAHWDARHNCYAFVLGPGNEVSRCTDDGEPSGTAGRPILEVLLGEGIHDALLIVTRYFGGVLLGTGGLVRAYTKAAQLAIEDGTVIVRRPGFRYVIGTDYVGIGKLQHVLGGMDAWVQDTIYEADVKINVVVSETEASAMEKSMTEATAGKVQFLEKTETVFAVAKDEVILFE